VRELERLMERVVALGGTDAVELDDLPPSVRGETAKMVSALEGKDTMRAWGSRYARLVLDRSGGNKRDACRVLGISYHTLNAYLRYPLHREPDRPVRWVDSGSDDGSGGAQAEVEIAEI
jgi:transcriptional regulator with AAA-type ATPase domain